MTEIQQMQTQLTEAFGRIQNFEDEIKIVAGVGTPTPVCPAIFRGRSTDPGHEP